MDSEPVDFPLDGSLEKDGANRRSYPAGSLSKRWLPVARVIWVLLAALLAALFLVGNLLYYQQAAASPTLGNFVQRSGPGAYVAALAQLGLSSAAYARIMVGLQLAFMLGSGIIGLLIFIRKNDTWWGLFVSFTLVSLGASYPTTTDALTRAYPAWGSFFSLVDALSLVCFLELFYLFPDGRFVPRWSRWAALALAATLILPALFPRSFVDLAGLPVAFTVVNSVLVVSMIYAQIYRYRHVSGHVERQQSKWVIVGMMLALFALVALGTAPLVIPGLASPDPRGALYDMVATAALLVVVLAVPLSIGISMLRYRLWDIDLIINRTLVYVPLTAIVAALYSVTVAVSQKFFIAFTGATSDAAVALSTLLVVTTFTRIRDAIQAVVNRHFRKTPDLRQRVNVLNQQLRWFVEVMDETEIARRTLDEAILAFQAAGGAVYLDRGERVALVYRAGKWDESSQACISVPLQGRDHQYGLLRLGERRAGLPYSREDREMLQQTGDLLARTIAIARRVNSPAAADSAELRP